MQWQTILANCSTEYYSCNSFEKMDPLSPLISLATNIKESIDFTASLIFSNRTVKIAKTY